MYKYLLFYSLFPMFNHFLCVYHVYDDTHRIRVYFDRKIYEKKTGGIFSCNKNMCSVVVYCILYNIEHITERVFFFSIHTLSSTYNTLKWINGWLCWVDVIVGEIFRWVANHTYVQANRWENSNNIIRPCIARVVF